MAELTKGLIKRMEEEKHQCAEYRISIYGRSRDEWAKIAHWFIENKLASQSVRWMIQIPRIYNVYKKNGSIKNMQEMLDNIFIPLFENTLNPQSNLELFTFLNCIVGIDSVDDESVVDSSLDIFDNLIPEKWEYDENPPYMYWMYFLYANLFTLNTFREKHNMSIFSLRPHCGEAGDFNHLASAYLVAESINHGINLTLNTSLQYLYFLSQVPLSVSPISNNHLFVKLNDNPFQKFFKRGLKVTLSTDDPLILHHTEDPLNEEYYSAAQIYNLSQCDLCEIARNSVLMSGYEHPFKCYFSGPNYYLPGIKGNYMNLTNIPDIRLSFREFVLTKETEILNLFSKYIKKYIFSSNDKEIEKEFLNNQINSLEEKLKLLKEKKTKL